MCFYCNDWTQRKNKLRFVIMLFIGAAENKTGLILCLYGLVVTSRVRNSILTQNLTPAQLYKDITTINITFVGFSLVKPKSEMLSHIKCKNKSEFLGPNTAAPRSQAKHKQKVSRSYTSCYNYIYSVS